MLLLYYYLIFFQIAIADSYLVFPLKTFYSSNASLINNSNSINAKDFLNYLANNELYTHFFVGTPKVKIYTFLESEDYESYMDNSICPLPSIYKNDSSSTFLRTSDFNIYYSSYSNMCFAKETFYAYTDFELNENKIKIMPNITFLYATKPNQDRILSKFEENINITGFSCFHMGLQITSSNFFDIIVNQLKKMDYIESTYWTIEFNSKNLYDINEKSYLVIGLPPHKYNSNKYPESAFRSTTAQLRLKDYDLRVSSWGIIFDKIYFSKNSSTSNIQFRSIKCKFLFSFNIIEGSRDYLDNIENEYFNNLYNKNICFKNEIVDDINENYYVIWCNKNNFTQIENFPTLYFYSIELNYTFELTYEDLFIEKGDKIFFLVIFKKRGYMFTFGKLFFKKYLLTFSFDNKLIGFYNKINKEIIKNKQLNNNSIDIKSKIIIIILALFCFCSLFIIFIIIKRKCLSERQKRMNELIDDNYVYMINKAKKDKSIMDTNEN